jgi:hypothetical protein
MNATRLFAALLVVLAGGFPAAAGTIVATTCGSCGFQTWSAADLNENGSPYFDNKSGDGLRENIGYWLTDTGGIDAGDDALSPAQAINYFGTASGDPALDYYFTASPAGASYDGQIKVEIAGFAGSNRFGWYVPGDPDSRTQIFGGSANQGDTFSFTLPAGQSDFGFYLRSGDNKYFYTESSLNAAGYQFQHFALFSNGGDSFWLGIEDAKLVEETLFKNGKKRIGDFNDMVVSFSEVPRDGEIPEPSTWAMLGSGLIALSLVRFRRRAK